MTRIASILPILLLAMSASVAMAKDSSHSSHHHKAAHHKAASHKSSSSSSDSDAGSKAAASMTKQVAGAVESMGGAALQELTSSSGSGPVGGTLTGLKWTGYGLEQGAKFSGGGAKRKRLAAPGGAGGDPLGGMLTGLEYTGYGLSQSGAAAGAARRDAAQDAQAEIDNTPSQAAYTLGKTGQSAGALGMTAGANAISDGKQTVQKVGETGENVGKFGMKAGASTLRNGQQMVGNVGETGQKVGKFGMEAGADAEQDLSTTGKDAMGKASSAAKAATSKVPSPKGVMHDVQAFGHDVEVPGGRLASAPDSDDDDDDEKSKKTTSKAKSARKGTKKDKRAGGPKLDGEDIVGVGGNQTNLESLEKTVAPIASAAGSTALGPELHTAKTGLTAVQGVMGVAEGAASGLMPASRGKHSDDDDASLNDVLDLPTTLTDELTPSTRDAAADTEDPALSDVEDLADELNDDAERRNVILPAWSILPGAGPEAMKVVDELKAGLGMGSSSSSASSSSSSSTSSAASEKATGTAKKANAKTAEKAKAKTSAKAEEAPAPGAGPGHRRFQEKKRGQA